MIAFLGKYPKKLVIQMAQLRVAAGITLKKPKLETSLKLCHMQQLLISALHGKLEGKNYRDLIFSVITVFDDALFP